MQNPAHQRLLQDTLRTSSLAAPDKDAVVANGERVTYAQLWDRSVRLSNALRAAGIGRGDRVVIFLDNGPECAIGLYATLLADGVFVVVNAQTKSDKLAFILKDCEAAALITAEPLASVWRTAAAASDSLRCIAVSGGAAANADPRERLLEETIATASDAAPQTRNISIDLCALIYTSGSTGEPKGVMHTHQSMRFALYSLIEYLKITDADRIVCSLPLAFDYGLYQLLMSIAAGATLFLESNFAYPARTFKLLESERITVFPGVPTIFAIINAYHARAPVCFPDVRCVTNTAAALPPSFNGVLRTIFPNAEIFRMYGLTECKRVCYLPPAELDKKPRSVGIAIPGTEVFVLDEAGRRASPGQPGVLYVRGAHVMLGYWRRPEQTAHMLKPGPFPGERMLCTHDVFTTDEDGYLYFVGRSDDIIKSRGEKVSPVEVEAVLHAIPGVQEAAVIGVEDAVQGEAVHALVKLHDGWTLTEAELRKLCGERMESFMVPSRIKFVDGLPKTMNGKIDKRALAQQG